MTPGRCPRAWRSGPSSPRRVVRPSGLKATLATVSAWPRRGSARRRQRPWSSTRQSTAVSVPPEASVPAVRAEGDGVDRASVPGERRAELPAVGHVPERDRPVLVARGQGAFLGMEGDAADRAGLLDGELPERSAPGHVPEEDGAVPAARGERAAVRAEGDAGDQVGVAGQRLGEALAGGHVPEDDRPVLAAGGERPAVGAERHRGGRHVAVQHAARPDAGVSSDPRARSRRHRWPASGRPG